MHGMIFWEFRNYAEEKYGAGTWLKLLADAGLEEKVYLRQPYPDTDMVALLTAASALTGKSLPTLLEEFGEFLAPSLMKMYGHLMQPEWRTLDAIEHAESIAHRAVRLAEVGAGPPSLHTRRIGPRQLTLIYSSPRKLCALAVGIAKGLGKLFNEEVVAHHSACMHLGAGACEIVFHTSAARSPATKAKSQKAGH